MVVASSTANCSIIGELRDGSRPAGTASAPPATPSCSSISGKNTARQMFERLRGQFAFALYDKQRRHVILARDRVGICPLHWAVQGDWLLFRFGDQSHPGLGQGPASRPMRGDSTISSRSLPCPAGERRSRASRPSCPGRYLKVRVRAPSDDAPDQRAHVLGPRFSRRRRGIRSAGPQHLIDEFDAALFRAVDIAAAGRRSGHRLLERRHRLGHGAGRGFACSGSPIPSFTVQIDRRGSTKPPAPWRPAPSARRRPCCAATAPRWPRPIRGLIERPIVPWSIPPVPRCCCLSGEVHRQGYKVALTGEGSDEALAGYPWFKFHRLLRLLDRGRFRPSAVAKRVLRTGS